MYVRVRFNGVFHLVADLSRLSDVRLLREKVADKTGVPPGRQRLIHGGKQLEDGCSLFDYDVKVNAILELVEKVVASDEEPKPGCSKGKSGASKKDDYGEPKPGGSGMPYPTDGGHEEDEDGQSKEGGRRTLRDRNYSGGSTVAEEVVKLEDIYDGDPAELQDGPECKKCKDDPKKKCGECGCVVCKGKDRLPELLYCDECDYVYHLGCLNPVLDAVPDGDWYCPDCRNDGEEIVSAGGKLKARKSRTNKPSKNSKRDWGMGMSTAGRSKSCTKVAANHFGPVPGVEVGMTWKFRIQLSEEGVHRPPVAGIAGKPSEGAQSIVLAGGFMDDKDSGEEFYYTGCGGCDLSTGNKRRGDQTFDQTLTKSNLAIAVSCHAKHDPKAGADAGDDWRKGKPVRVVRSDKSGKRSEYAPEEGCRYDGIYKVVKYWPEKGRSGFLVWRYLFRRDDNAPAPWTKEGRRLCEKNGYTCVYPDGYLESMAEKVKTYKGANEDEVMTPPTKKSKKTKYEIDEDVKVLIRAEKQNKKVLNLIMEKAMSTKLDFTNALEEHFTCPLCQYLIFLPVTTRCNHNFCCYCFRTIFQKSETKACPNCRKPLEEKADGVANEELSQILTEVFPGYGLDR